MNAASADVERLRNLSFTGKIIECWVPNDEPLFADELPYNSERMSTELECREEGWFTYIKYAVSGTRDGLALADVYKLAFQRYHSPDKGGAKKEYYV